ncbi:hypothetical protein CAPTEDRAFT_175631 [Capitella teleta]|uniref:Peroxisomal membrane protein 11C n=1 Tax=Capitella teleta TaxID=283909 RepID=R7TIJ6_CAPTE|nr:hypothetical protein CAPTEDRAFT_175631 [Capitella teleta]|eukprot:ELT91351.1 hypothetical protein CAPTEDRAFT_175631 [Capitella teleta]
METYVALLQTYSGRDKIIRTTAYTCVLLTGASKGKMAKTLATIAKNIGAARTVLRLFDDLPMWTLTRKFGSTDSDLISRVCSALGNIAIQFYYPFEKIAWAADQEILPVASQKWWDLGIVSWAVYLVFFIIRGFRQICILRSKRFQVVKRRKLESPEKSGAKDEEYRTKIHELASEEMGLYLDVVKNCADLVMAVNWLPAGYLWAGKLSPARNAAFGTLSSFIGLYVLWKDMSKKLRNQKAKTV